MDISKLILNRTVGLEIEGYIKTSPASNGFNVRHCRAKHDYSLSNRNWNTRNKRGTWGVELVTPPISSFEPIIEAFEDIERYGWSSRGACGLHVHVDTSDFTIQDKVKVMNFAKKLEDVIFLFVKTGRYGNRYCQNLTNTWSQIDSQDKRLDWKNISNIYELTDNYRRVTGSSLGLYTGKYNWLNVWQSRFSTIEFRLFNAIASAEEGIKFAYLAHNIIELIKSSTSEQLNFIVESIENEPDIKEKAKKFLATLGIPYAMRVTNLRAKHSLVMKEERKVSIKRVASA